LGEWLDTELLYREAMSLELHHNDEVVRNHLASKLRHMVREATVPDQPSDAELEAQLESHRERYTVQDSYTLTSVFLLRRPDTSTEQHRERVDSVLAQLRAGAAPEGLGDHFPRGPHFSKLP